MPGDSIIALSTCEKATNANRIVLFGKLVPLTKAQMAALEAANNEEMQEGGLPSAAPSERLSARHVLALFLAGIIAAILFAIAYRLHLSNKR